MDSFDINFSKPDKYGEIHANLKLPLKLSESPIYLNLSINGDNPIKFHFYYNDIGTIGYASMHGRYAIGGRLTNVSMDWGNVKKTDEFRIINAIGTLDNGIANLNLFQKA